MKNSNLNFLLRGLGFLLSCLLCSTGVIAADSLIQPASPSSLQTSTFELTPLSSALPADSAFVLSVLIELPDSIVLMWDIKEGYYLYRKSLSFSEAGGEKIETLQIPDGEYINDEFFGEVEVYYGKLLIRIPFSEISSSTQKDLQLQLAYQGCAEIGYCYPMQHKTVSVELP